MTKKETALSPDGAAAASRAFLDQLPRAELVDLIMELAGTVPAVGERLARRQLASNPAKLAARFRQRLQGWRRATRFMGWREAGAFGRGLEAWLDEIERELLPSDPARAHALVEAYLEADHIFFDHADDSNGAIGDAIRAGCRLWLKAAQAHPPTEIDWVERVHALVKADQYGARDELLRCADSLFDEPALRVLAGRFEGDLYLAMERETNHGAADYSRYAAGAAICLLADVLQDPDLSTKAVLSYRPHPNPLQKAQFADRYLRFGRAHEALRWLEGQWEVHEDQRQRLLARVYEALGDAERLTDTRRRLFTATGSAEDFLAYRARLPASAWETANAEARDRAQATGDVISAAHLLLAIEDDRGAEGLLVDRQASIRGESYYHLLPIAETLESRGRLLGAVACYRALLEAVLARAYVRAYAHGARYLAKLRSLAPRIGDYGALSTHDELEQHLQAKHGRKTSFWSHVKRV